MLVLQLVRWAQMLLEQRELCNVDREKMCFESGRNVSRAMVLCCNLYSQDNVSGNFLPLGTADCWSYNSTVPIWFETRGVFLCSSREQRALCVVAHSRASHGIRLLRVIACTSEAWDRHAAFGVIVSTPPAKHSLTVLGDPLGRLFCWCLIFPASEIQFENALGMLKSVQCRSGNN